VSVKRFFSYIDVRRFPRRRKIHFFINVSVGIVIAVFFHFLEHTDWGEATINKAFDFIIAKEAEKSAEAMESLTAQRNIGISDRIVFAEIDHETYKKWGKPLITPRDKLAEIIKIASEGGAKIIALDILLEDKDCCHPESDCELRKVLQDMTDKKAAAKVIFPVRIGYDGKARKNIFQDLIDNNPNFYAATASIAAAATDRVVRYWVPFATVKNGSDDTILWNMPFLIAMLAEGKEREIKEFGNIIKAGRFHKAHHFTLDHNRDITISPERDEIYRNRIRFLLVPQNTLPGHPGGNLFDTVYQIDEIRHATVRDKIVIIGNSSPDAGDMHPTPVGNMAGIFIIGNAINTISLGLQPSHSPLLLNIAIEAVIVIMAAFLFLYFPSLLAQILGSAVLILCLGVVSYYFFLYTGIFLNFIFAVIGMSFHRTIANIEEITKKKGGRVHEHS
jgi:CHASE2 domain-containing sensor protein